MNLIVNVDLDWGIGLDDALLERIPDDMKFFRKMTLGKVVILGRKTLASFSGGKPLKDRTNIVLTTNTKLECGDAIICNSIEDLLNKLVDYKSEDIFVIGGETVYRQLLPYCSKAYVTKTYKHHAANKFFPDLDLSLGLGLSSSSDSSSDSDSDSDSRSNWTLIEISPMQIHNEIEFNFNIYENKNLKY